MTKKRIGTPANKPVKGGYICIFGCRKADLIAVGIPKNEIISEHDYHNWVFYVPLKYMEVMGYSQEDIAKHSKNHEKYRTNIERTGNIYGYSPY